MARRGARVARTSEDSTVPAAYQQRAPSLPSRAARAAARPVRKRIALRRRAAHARRFHARARGALLYLRWWPRCACRRHAAPRRRDTSRRSARCSSRAAARANEAGARGRTGLLTSCPLVSQLAAHAHAHAPAPVRLCATHLRSSRASLRLAGGCDARRAYARHCRLVARDSAGAQRQ